MSDPSMPDQRSVTEQLQDVAALADANGHYDAADHIRRQIAPEYQAQPHMHPPETWTLTLNRYQRDNLLWLLQLMGYSHFDRKVEPFHLANTGDWVGEIHNMLGAASHTGGYPSWDPRRANRTIAEIREAVTQWVKSQA